MHDRAAWSLSLGQWRGVHVRLHMFFFLFAACALILRWYLAKPLAELDWVIPASLLVLFSSVLIHEIGHIWFARRSDGISDLIVLGPLGGMVPVHVAGNARAEFKAHLAGPATNLLICGICAALLGMLKVPLLGLLNPVLPIDLTSGSVTQVVVKLTFWINWVLLLVNLVPAFPLDGAFALRSAILDRWPMIRPADASLIVARTGQILAGLLAIGAVFWKVDEDEFLVPIRLTLLVFAILLFFAARQRSSFEDRDGAEHLLLGYELTGSLDALERDLDESTSLKSGPLGRWLSRRRQARLRRQHELELEDEQRVDEILSRLHEGGMRVLSDEDLAILHRVSIRYRSRM
jgi:stage IV sporulation protein FB